MIGLSNHLTSGSVEVTTLDKVKIFSIFDPPPQVSVKFEDKSLTQQHFKEECDINNIMRRYMNGEAVMVPNSEPIFGDFSMDFDFQTAQNTLIDATNRFMMLSSEVRERFGNDPAKLLQFLTKRENLDEAIKLGLVPKPVEPEPDDKADKTE
jgi:phage internal scaffolding protein